MFGKHKLTAGVDLKALFQPKGFSDFQGLSQKAQPAPPGWFLCTAEVFHHQGWKPLPLSSQILCPRGKQRGQQWNPQFCCPCCSLGWGGWGTAELPAPTFPIFAVPSPFAESWWSPWQRSTTPWQSFWQKLQQKSSFSGGERCSNLPTISLAGCTSN